MYCFYLLKDIVLAEHKKLLEEQKLINKGYTEVIIFGVLIRVTLCPVALIGIFIKELCAQWRCASSGVSITSSDGTDKGVLYI